MNDANPQTSSSLISINFGNGLVEIAALTTLIGSTTAEALILGNWGSAGLVWGPITMFGSSSVIKACASAALPGWLRHMLGLRTPASDGAVGMDLSLVPDSKVARSVRSNLHSPLGVLRLSESDSDDLDNHNTSPIVNESLSYRDVYAFDHITTVMLELLTPTSPGEPLTVYTHQSYPFFEPHNVRFQVSMLGLSLLKCFEVYFLLTHGAALMGLLSAIPFAFSFFAATLVEIRDITISRRPMDIDGHIDLVAGTLPTTKQSGGPKKVVLGAMKNSRTSIWWQIFWAISALLQITSLVLSYFILGQQKTQFVLTWAAFQIVWVILRILVAHLRGSFEPTTDRPMGGHNLDALSLSQRLRVANLVLAVGNYQMHLHPRRIDAYRGDSLSVRQMASVLVAPNIREVYELPNGSMQYNSPIQVNIRAVIGDTVLASAAWMAGSKLTPMDLYDSCIVVFDLPPTKRQPQRTIAIPAARVYGQRFIQQATMSDSESTQPFFRPRGVGTSISDNEEQSCDSWMYWIPCDSGVWLQFVGATVLGKVAAELTDDEQLTKRLSAGTMKISLRDVEEVKAIVEVSRKATNILLSFLH